MAPPPSRFFVRRRRGVDPIGAYSSSEGPASFAVARALDAERLYAKRFRAYEGDLPAFRFYRLLTRRMKLFDERVLGGGTFVTVSVQRGGRLKWDRTESFS